ncbi:MAG: hypothetical protein PHT91_01100 [Candidatus Nanoarchaeia archaeon]|nr:hypothetical protein [Candidatus Nanoarchaeia archaeon]MDD5054037.1 hypothetical protein [Candidatus Nanoarchaeia archaeon]MDD5499455.1 hypothetical protein [Candidatus Nanoarchaeia archaeon]
MNSLRYKLFGKTPHNADDLVDYCLKKEDSTISARVDVKAYKNNAFAPITGTEYVFRAEISCAEKGREFNISAYSGSSSSKELSEESVANLKKEIKAFGLAGVKIEFASNELENLLK